MPEPENVAKEPIRVFHSSLKLYDTDSAYKAVCPTCKSGLLLVHRDQKTFFLERHDRCVSCGQAFHYLDDMINGEAFTDTGILELKPMIWEALERVAVQTGLSYQRGCTVGGVIKLFEYCTFNVTGFEAVVLGGTFRENQGDLYFDLDLVGEESGNIYWNTGSVKVPWSGDDLRRLVEQSLLRLPGPSVVLKVFGPN